MYLEAGIIAAFLAMLCWGAGDFFIQKNVRKIGNIEALALIGAIGTAGLFPFVLKDLPLLSSSNNLYLLLALGIITFVAAIFDFEALRKGKLSVMEVIITLELPVTIFLGIIFLNEALSIAQGLIILPIFAGILLMATKSFSLDAPFKGLEKGAIIGLAAAVTLGFVNFFTAAGSKTISPIMAIWIPWVIVTIISITVIIKTGKLKQLYSDIKEFKGIIIIMGILDTAAWLFYAVALENNPLSIITAITESYPAIAIVLAVWINNEQIKRHQYFGASLALVASFLLALTI
jgi:drug/metabolite transporter (DMT)-like permease